MQHFASGGFCSAARSRSHLAKMPYVRSCGISQNVGVKVEKNSKEIETEIAENCLVYYIASCPPISRQLPPRGVAPPMVRGWGGGARGPTRAKRRSGLRISSKTPQRSLARATSRSGGPGNGSALWSGSVIQNDRNFPEVVTQRAAHAKA